MRHITALLVPLRLRALLCAMVVSFGRLADARSSAVSEQCLMDLEAIPSFLMENDAGAKEEWAQWGAAHFDAALRAAREEAARVQDPDACRLALNAYLKAWRKGHLLVNDRSPAHSGAPGAALDAALRPTIRPLSAKTVLLTVPSFASQARQPLVELLGRHRAQLAVRANWIIDVRGNDGGSDDTYDSLLAWLVPGEREDIGAEWLATPANIEGERQACALYAPGDRTCESASAEAVSRMSSVPSGSYVSQEEGPVVRYLRPETTAPHRPARVAVLMDKRCASSCEEFLLTVRQSFTVKLVGQPSRGSLDYSNLRPHVLPSGQRVLRYAISRSERLPDLPVDLSGVQPDLYLPAPADADASAAEVKQIQRWLEAGSLALP